jgi:predicted P-loop ATPase
MAPLDYAGIALTLLAQAPNNLTSWLPGGKVSGKYYKCASIQGGPGDSFLVNLETGLWGEFNGEGTKGKDLIDLYAAIKGLTNHNAALELTGQQIQLAPLIVENKAPQTQKKDPIIVKPPKDAPKPSWGSPSKTWLYKDANGEQLFYITRFDRPGKSKMILPWGWSQDEGKWVSKSYPAPRPLYGLELLSKAPKSAVLLVEGEKACDAARELMGSVYVVMTWPGGAGAVDKIDWKPLEGRRVLLWPDADDPGTRAMLLIASKIAPMTQEIKILNPQAKPNPKADGWDAADATKEGWNQSDVITWAKERLTVLSTNGTPVAPPPSMGSRTEYIAKEPATTVQQVEDVTDQVEVTQSLTVKWLNTGLATSSKGIPIYNEENVLRIFERDNFFKEFIWYDTFHKKYFTRWGDSSMNGHIRTWKDEVDFFRITSYLQRRWGMSKISTSQVTHSTIEYANQHPKNEPLDWIKSLEWDGKERIETCLSDAFGVLPSRYTYGVSKNFFVAMAARIVDPGCKFDNMVVFEGKQETYKSTSLAILGGSWYASIRHQIGSPNFFNAIQGKWLVEIAEMDSFNVSQISAIKDFLSNPTDRFRLPYAKATEDFPRVCVFAGTTNERTFLGDKTGLRRFWTIATAGINLKYLRDNREQLFAEAYALYSKGTPWHIIDKKEHAEAAEERRMQDPWEEIISGFIHDKSSFGVLSSEIMCDCLGIPKERQDMKQLNRLGKIMRFLGWDTRNQRGSDLVQRKVWFPIGPDTPPENKPPAALAEDKASP